MMQHVVLLLFCAAAIGALALFVTLWVIGPTHNVGVLFTALIVAGVAVHATLAIGVVYIRKLGG
jgi:ABC-type Fe3+-siderophore transport system permease subunit